MNDFMTETIDENRLLVAQGVESIGKLNVTPAFLKKLGGSVTYQMACIGIEAVLTGVLFNYNEVIEHGNILLMIKKLAKHTPIPEDWYPEARFINRFENFCSLDIAPQTHPAEEDLVRIAAFAREIGIFGNNYLQNEKVSA